MLRIAAIEFLNAAPLMWGLEADERFQLTHTLPAACADHLRAGTADLGVIPVIELARIPGLTGLDGIGVAARAGTGEAAEVRSILLISRKAPAEVARVALDQASRTSAALAQILLRERWGARFTVMAGSADWRRVLEAGPEQADAALLIGDPALRLRISGAAAAAGFEVRDLAREWQEWTGTPFVFALWGMRSAALEENRSWLPARLGAALSDGLAHREELVAHWAPRLHLPDEEIRRYLADNVAYRLTPAHREGMRRFFALAAAAGLVPGAALPRLEAAAGA